MSNGRLTWRSGRCTRKGGSVRQYTEPGRSGDTSERGIDTFGRGDQQAEGIEEGASACQQHLKLLQSLHSIHGARQI